jgi:hypothetical protein
VPQGGFYANDLLGNLGHPSARELLPEYQRLEIGQWVPMSPTPSEATALRVAGFEENRWQVATSVTTNQGTWEAPPGTTAGRGFPPVESGCVRIPGCCGGGGGI